MMMAEDGGRPKSPLRRKSSILELERRKKEKQKEIIDDSGGGSSSRWPKLAFFYPKSHATGKLGFRIGIRVSREVGHIHHGHAMTVGECEGFHGGLGFK